MQKLMHTCVFYNDHVERIIAEMGINSLMRSDPDSFLTLTSNVFSDTTQNSKIRHLSALLFKSCAIDMQNQDQIIPSRDEFKLKFINELSSESKEVRLAACNILIKLFIKSQVELLNIIKLYTPGVNLNTDDSFQTLLLYFIQDYGGSFTTSLSYSSLFLLIHKIIKGCSNDDDEFNSVTICILDCIKNIDSEFTIDIAESVVKECIKELENILSK